MFSYIKYFSLFYVCLNVVCNDEMNGNRSSVCWFSWVWTFAFEVEEHIFKCEHSLSMFSSIRKILLKKFWSKKESSFWTDVSHQVYMSNDVHSGVRTCMTHRCLRFPYCRTFSSPHTFYNLVPLNCSLICISMFLHCISQSFSFQILFCSKIRIILFIYRMLLFLVAVLFFSFLTTVLYLFAFFFSAISNIHYSMLCVIIFLPHFFFIHFVSPLQESSSVKQNF